MKSREAMASALQHQRQGRLEEAKRAYLQILEHDSRNADALHFLGTVYLAQGRADEAARYLRQSLAVDPQCALAHVNLGTALRVAGNLTAAVECYQHAARLNPSDAMIWNNLAGVLAESGRSSEALTACDRAVAIQPNLAHSHLNRGTLLLKLGRNDAALQAYDCAIALQPDNHRARARRAVVLAALNRFPEALSAAEQAKDAAPSDPQVLIDHVTVLSRAGRSDEAAEQYKRILERDPNNLRALIGWANLNVTLGRTSEACAIARMAVTRHPGAADAHLALANAEIEALSPAAALESCERALRCHPGIQRAHALAGRALSELAGRWHEAYAAFDRAITPETNDAPLYFARGIAAEQCGKLVEAAADYAKAVELDPQLPRAACNAVFARLRLCDWSSYCADVESIVAMSGRSPFAVTSLVDDPALQLTVARQFDELHAPRVMTFPMRKTRNDGPLNVGFVSPDFGNHTVTHAFIELVERHSRRQFQFTGFSISPDDGTATRQRLVRAFDHFADLAGASDSGIAREIAGRQIDILIDLAGYTRGGRPGILKQRPAPLQVNFLGYPGTLGCAAVDYIIADRFVIPTQAQPHYQECLARLPECFMPYDTTRTVADPGSRSTHGLPETAFVFCAMNAVWKINPPMFDLWMRLLRRVPDSVLWLQDAGPIQAANLRHAAEQRGVSAMRLIFAQRAEPDSAYLARFRLADLFLDTYPYNAHQTACDALWAGLPVVTFAGNGFAARVAGSVLLQAGLLDLVAPSLSAYEQLAFDLAVNPTRLQTARAQADAAKSSPLFDSNRYCQHFESALRRMWELHEAGEPPRNFMVEPMPFDD
jgi:predicted O-linked N-acetylglucosamine transferase (SPINDLY family)